MAKPSPPPPLLVAGPLKKSQLFYCGFPRLFWVAISLNAMVTMELDPGRINITIKEKNPDPDPNQCGRYVLLPDTGTTHSIQLVRTVLRTWIDWYQLGTGRAHGPIWQDLPVLQIRIVWSVPGKNVTFDSDSFDGNSEHVDHVFRKKFFKNNFKTPTTVY